MEGVVLVCVGQLVLHRNLNRRLGVILSCGDSSGCAVGMDGWLGVGEVCDRFSCGSRVELCDQPVGDYALSSRI